MGFVEFSPADEVFTDVASTEVGIFVVRFPTFSGVEVVALKANGAIAVDVVFESVVLSFAFVVFDVLMLVVLLAISSFACIGRVDVVVIVLLAVSFAIIIVVNAVALFPDVISSSVVVVRSLFVVLFIIDSSAAVGVSVSIPAASVALVKSSVASGEFSVAIKVVSSVLQFI